MWTHDEELEDRILQERRLMQQILSEVIQSPPEGHHANREQNIVTRALRIEVLFEERLQAEMERGQMSLERIYLCNNGGEYEPLDATLIAWAHGKERLPVTCPQVDKFVKWWWGRIPSAQIQINAIMENLPHEKRVLGVEIAKFMVHYAQHFPPFEERRLEVEILANHSEELIARLQEMLLKDPVPPSNVPKPKLSLIGEVTEGVSPSQTGTLVHWRLPTGLSADVVTTLEIVVRVLAQMVEHGPYLMVMQDALVEWVARVLGPDEKKSVVDYALRAWLTESCLFPAEVWLANEY